MSWFTGYVVLPTNTYLAYWNATAGNGYDADFSYGCQCWDLCAEFWYNIGFPQGYPHTGPNHYVSECWTVNRVANCSYDGVTYFDLIEDVNSIKKGDVVVFDGSPGHIGFANEDYNGGAYISILGQNQGSGGVPPAVDYYEGGTSANVKNLSASNILGAFRYRGWITPIVLKKQDVEKKFPWAIYARKFRLSR